MIAEQLQAARAAHWRQNQSPILTLDDAQSWMTQHPLCLYLPRHAQLPAPAPSFVEACLGKLQTAPSLASIEQAHTLLIRLVASGTVVPLNLFGVVGEQPDFLAHRDALPAVLSLRADPDWKRAPQKSSGHKVSPLVLELWKVLDKEGTVTAEQAREILGRELTEAAVLRALCELWQALRVSPVYAEPGQPARWELLREHHRDALAKAGSTGQVTAISLLVSMYLQSVYSATSDEIEIFLSPVTSRSRVREAVRGLSATRQIQSLSMDAQTYYFLENGLPEFAEIAPAAETEQPVAAPGEAIRPYVPARPTTRKRQATTPAAAAFPPASSAGSEPIFRRPKPEIKPEARPEFRPAAKAPASAPASRAGWKSQGRPAAPGRTGFAGRPPRPQTDRPSASRPRWGASDADRSRPASGTRPPFRSTRPFTPGEGAERPAASSAPRPAGRPQSGTRPYARPAAGGARPGGARFGGARPSGARPGGARPGGARLGGARFDGARTGNPRSADRSRDRGPAGSGAARPYTRPAGTGSRPPSRPGAPPRAWAGTGKPTESKPWALPGRKSGSTSRPPRTGGRSDTPFRSAPRRYDRPAAGAGPGSTGAESIRPRAPRSDRGSGDAYRSRPAREADSTSGRPPVHSPRPPAAYGGSRPPASAGRPAGSGRPPYRANPERRGPAGTRPSSRRPSSSSGEASSPRPRSGPPRGEGPARPPRGNRPSFDRPRPGGFAKSETKSGSDSRDPKGRPPFKPGSRPAKPFSAGTGAAKPWSRTGGSSRTPGGRPPAGRTGGRPGKPSSSFRGPKPDRKKPGE